MRLKFKQQSTFYTCVQATQAIALNTFLNTDYCDLDVVASNNQGYPLGLSIITLAQDLTRRRLQIPYSQIHLHLAQGMFRQLITTRRLPTYEEAIQSYIKFSIQSQRRFEENLRKNPVMLVIGGSSERSMLTPEEVENIIREHAKQEEEKRRTVKRSINDGSIRRFYHEFARDLDEGLLRPINYRISEADYDDFSGLVNLSNGSLVVEQLDPKLIAESSQKGDIVIFGARRDELGLPEHSSGADHSFIVDRIEGNEVILLDTNHYRYGHGPEVNVPLTRILEMKLNHVFRIYQK